MALQIGRSRVPYLLKANKKTQLQLAEYLDVTQSFISKVCRGEKQFNLEMAGNAARFLNCQIEDLVEWIESP